RALHRRERLLALAAAEQDRAQNLVGARARRIELDAAPRQRERLVEHARVRRIAAEAVEKLAVQRDGEVGEAVGEALVDGGQALETGARGLVLGEIERAERVGGEQQAAGTRIAARIGQILGVLARAHDAE